MSNFEFIGNTAVSQSYKTLLHTSSSVALDGTGSLFTAPYVNTVFKIPQISGSVINQSTTTGNYSLAANSSTGDFKFGVHKHNMLVLGLESSLPTVVTGSVIFYDGELYLGIEDSLPY